MAVASGKSGSVQVSNTTIGEVTRWTFDKGVNSGRFASSASGGYKRSVGGVKSGNGSISMKFDYAAAAGVKEGSAVTLQLYLDTSTHFYSVPALVTRMEVMVDIDNGEPTSVEFNFDTDGAWSEPSGL